MFEYCKGGKTVEWCIETVGLGALRTKGMGRETAKVGETYSFAGSGRAMASRLASCEIQFADGRKFQRWTGNRDGSPRGFLDVLNPGEWFDVQPYRTAWPNSAGHGQGLAWSRRRRRRRPPLWLSPSPDSISRSSRRQARSTSCTRVGRWSLAMDPGFGCRNPGS
jgi:hypothetical protein